MGLLSPLAPYALAIKLGIAGIALVAAFTGGCQVQKSWNAALVAKKDAALAQAARDLRDAGSALREVGRLSAIEVGKAKANAAAGDRAAAEARAAAAKYRDQLPKLEAEIEAAKRRSPECRRILELPTCAVLR